MNCPPQNDVKTWKTISLIDFLQEGNVPRGWNDFMRRNDVWTELCKISEYLEERAKNSTIYPPIHQVFDALNRVRPDEIKGVLIAQDPYHDGAANGLCFCVNSGFAINPSLRNIYLELENEGYSPVKNGNISHWADQGILMLNNSLTVEMASPDIHTSRWAMFSSLLVDHINTTANSSTITWLLFGGKSQKTVARKNILGIVRKTSHPSPLGAHKGSIQSPAFIGSGVFRTMPAMLW